MPRIPVSKSRASRVTRSSRSSRNTRNGPSPLQSRLSSLFREARWILFAFLAVWLGISLYTWSSQDPGWMRSSMPGVEVTNMGGVAGAHVADVLLLVFGFSAWWWVVLLAQRVRAGYRRLARMFGLQAEDEADSELPRVRWEQGLGFGLILLGSVGLEALRFYSWGMDLPAASSTASGAGGVIGQLLKGGLQEIIGFTGSTLALLVIMAIGLSLFFGFSWVRLAERIGFLIETVICRIRDAYVARQDRRVGAVAKAEREEQVVAKQEKMVHEPVRIEPAVREVQKSPRVEKEKQQTLFTDAVQGDLPALNLLDPAPEAQETVSQETIEYTSRLIEKKLADFGVQVTVVAAQAGPVITRYEIEPATGVKGSQIVNLAKDLARALSMVNIRVVETIPGKNLMGLELPNPRRQMVKLSEILGSRTYHDSASVLTMALGKDIAGNPVVADLARMPHVLVAGTTGSGKSVGINAMILSLLYKADANHTRLILIDPKMLEMSVYEGIPHLLAPVVTDMRQAANALNWCVNEMEKRYRLMSKLGVRNLAGYNAKIREAEKREENIPNPFSLTPDAPEPLGHLPHIVVFIDELADLMMVVGKKIEELIARLAQKARAAGIHLVLATQRPSVDVITGLIKANIPTRIAFQVSSKIDSRTILDQMGAETLLGQGDMLYMPPGSGLPERVHGAFVSDDEVHRVVESLKEQGEANYVEGLLEGAVEGETGDGVSSVTGFADAESDPLYDQAVEIVLKNKRASISLVQRHLRIGYNRAARLLEQMEVAGVVSPMQSNGNREILAPRRDDDAD
ncbi:DNA translocase FtsK [Kerstersia gyiorum]|uniref:Cell division protein FtsK n=1 Tax=Kerstersia gyiorum TaxID=206506 RepID=A0A171KVK1_9BURK|nr:DNA translocase FtsK [Kerstersia gyiorum]KAB0542653.1 DNA translocase FtsK [Kerstersia gyiorum]KKO72918.1 cell division protein FtsK [Kerstersia gyiorum]RZS73877.1 DNA translocase FtsK [Kerstersia gyiorum]